MLEQLFRTMRHRMSWTNAKKILNASGLSTSHGWDSTLKKVEETAVQVNYGRLEDALVEHLLCGEKYTKLYPVAASKRQVIQQAISDITIDDGPAYIAYPHLMEDIDLHEGTGDMSVVQVESNEDGVGVVLSSVFWIKKREEILFDDFDDPAAMRTRYDEVVGLVRRPVQLFHVVWMPHHRDFLEIRVDHPRGVAEADVHGLHSVLKTMVNKWSGVDIDQPVNLFPAVQPFYDDTKEGTVTQMTFQTTTGGIKDEKMPRRRKNADQRTEAYHVAGKSAVEAIAIYRITVEWGFAEDNVSYNPSITLSASGPAGKGKNGSPTISGALINNCVRAADYEFVIDRLGTKANLDIAKIAAE
ncbi:hypothetical protein [uncultured Aliiroseovarius sp.]|uniref:hypothetical protein n=1 Tax=uncultured Aliiroseovarius sp. TaxID=1658783 RepID=UPI0026038149|nr:hypothetical protein [uncultured Aliiroseovarius sp.]